MDSGILVAFQSLEFYFRRQSLWACKAHSNHEERSHLIGGLAFPRGAFVLRNFMDAGVERVVLRRHGDAWRISMRRSVY
jgi:hypothetical protein